MSRRHNHGISTWNGPYFGCLPPGIVVVLPSLSIVGDVKGAGVARRDSADRANRRRPFSSCKCSKFEHLNLAG
ncbi:hypothetical protein JYU34_002782 [Plutella xylostella]|uniref:Uncharacterized protein n=1 Tax=Plutella xylostella TaxID=51655 RepID=A0ABQ7R366_PLUXY|nr:hypothetical protein JYU34_002782 [Plutella xylostella]